MKSRIVRIIIFSFFLLNLLTYLLPYSVHAAADHSVLCGEGSEQINTAIGCIPVGNPQELTSFLLRWAIGIGGGVAMIFIVYAGFLIMTSSGNPKQVQAGKELLTAAVTGLVFLIMSAFLLNFIGVEILSLPNI